MASLFLAMVLRTPFTKPFSEVKPFICASFTASLHAAASGTLSIYKNWYTLILKIIRITGFIFFVGTLEKQLIQ
jgi:hypothetical protein